MFTLSNQYREGRPGSALLARPEMVLKWFWSLNPHPSVQVVRVTTGFGNKMILTPVCQNKSECDSGCGEGRVLLTDLVLMGFVPVCLSVIERRIVSA